MSSAFGEPPLSGVIASANAVPVSTNETPSASRTADARRRNRRLAGVRAKARRILFTASGETARRWRDRLYPAEGRLALLDEGRHALGEVARSGHLLLDVGLERELVLHARVEPVVELALAARVGARRPVGQAIAQLGDLLGEVRVGHDAVDQAPLERLRGGDALAEHGHLAGAREAH